ncbi:LOW QUALITY PROTEIN: hypothetical protein, conserved [Eimeria necatrix]|uniref:Uncharacterized protein n=1 Tax=Eimeria necatrix TaxID=51315 RepID=U6MM07_9EIME|nr:LOW QUALITY PROTEIN: hypothetical protein, conserved [Eimeria necatrix]CDJ65282.1 hypothetical protein, conserved [Eimeria necatrix]
MASLWLARLRAPHRGVSSGGVLLQGAFRPLAAFQGVAPHQRPTQSPQTRAYANLSDSWGFKKVQYTKYRITKPWTTDTQFDDILLSEPSRESLAKFTKEAPPFLRFLKLVTDVENRPQAFIEYALRCRDGLVVEKDVYITKAELMKCIWENGYSENEMNAFEFAFPADYKFHYPELAVLFDLPEEECYKYCMRQRAKTPEELVEVKYEKPKNLLSSYGLCFLGVWYGFSNQVLSNAWFYSKTFPFGAVFYMLASYFYRNIREYLWKEDKALIQGAKERKDAGEELVHRQLKKYANDARCVEYLSSFKEEVQQQLQEYHEALLEQMRENMVKKMNSKLLSIQQAEQAIQGSLHEVIVNELVDSFHKKVETDAKMQDAALKAAIEAISGESPSVDPVGAHFRASLKELQSADAEGSKPAQSGSVRERVSAIFRRREQEFLEMFTVSPEEADEVKRITGKCKSGNGYDFSKLSKEEADRLDNLQQIIFDRVGYTTVTENDIKPLTAVGESGAALIEHVNNQSSEQAVCDGCSVHELRCLDTVRRPGSPVTTRTSERNADRNICCRPTPRQNLYLKDSPLRQLVEMRGTAIRTAFGGLEEVQAVSETSSFALRNSNNVHILGCRHRVGKAGTRIPRESLFTLLVTLFRETSDGLLPHLADTHFWKRLSFTQFVMPVFAFISDSYPLRGGRRKPYMIAFSLLEGLGFIMLGTFPTHVRVLFVSVHLKTTRNPPTSDLDSSALPILDIGIFLATSIFPLFIAFITLFMEDVGGAPSYDMKTQLRLLMEFLKQCLPHCILRFTYGIAALVGVVMYRTFFKRTGFRKTLLATILVAVPIYLSPNAEVQRVKQYHDSIYEKIRQQTA